MHAGSLQSAGPRVPRSSHALAPRLRPRPRRARVHPASRVDSRPARTALSRGEPAPALVFTDLEGRTVPLASFAGKVVVLNYWATWCAPCLTELPSLDRLHRALSRDGLVVLAVSVDEGGADVEGFVRERGFAFTVLRDRGGAQAARELGSTGYPTTFVIDRGPPARALPRDRRVGPPRRPRPLPGAPEREHLAHEVEASRDDDGVARAASRRARASAFFTSGSRWTRLREARGPARRCRRAMRRAPTRGRVSTTARARGKSSCARPRTSLSAITPKSRTKGPERPQVRGQRAGPGGVVGAVEEQGRAAGKTLQPPRPAHARKAPAPRATGRRRRPAARASSRTRARPRAGCRAGGRREGAQALPGEGRGDEGDASVRLHPDVHSVVEPRPGRAPIRARFLEEGAARLLGHRAEDDGASRAHHARLLAGDGVEGSCPGTPRGRSRG